MRRALFWVVFLLFAAGAFAYLWKTNDPLRNNPYLADELHELSTQQRWEEMPKYVTDEVLETIAVVGTYEDVARKIKKRYGDFATRVEFSLPVQSPADHNRVRAVIRELHEG